MIRESCTTVESTLPLLGTCNIIPFFPIFLNQVIDYSYIFFFVHCGLKLCKAVVGSWLWQFILPLFSLLTGALSTLGNQVEGHETRYICNYLCFISRIQSNFWICFCTLRWRLFCDGDGQGSSIINKHLHFIYQNTEFGII